MLQRESVNNEKLAAGSIVTGADNVAVYADAFWRDNDDYSINGFAEAEINLGVALYLYGFLKEKGAEVILTRTTDCEVAEGENIELRDDLQARCDIANQANAALFVSIHHNSDYDPRRNEIQVYYQIEDPGPSFDLAIETGVVLFESIGPRDTDISPGNYYVMRNTRAIAILGEAAFLSCEEDEKRLAFFRALREEARAYSEGIINHLTKGLPRISGLMPDGQVLKDSPSEISGFIKDDKGVDSSSLRMIVDGRQVKFDFDPATGKVSYCPETALSNSQHSFTIEGRNTAGNAAKAGRGSFTVDRPPDRITVSLAKEDRETVVQQSLDLITFTSPSTVHNFKKAFGLLDVPVAVIGPITEQAAVQAGFTVAVSPEVYTMDGLLKEIITYFQREDT